MKRYLLAFAVSILTACGGSAPPAQDAAPPQASSAAELRLPHDAARRLLFSADAFHSALIERFGPVQGFLALATDGVTYLVNGHDIVQGRADVRSLLEELEPEPATVTVRRTLAGGDVSADGAFGFTFGWIERTAPGADGSPAVTYGTYTACWRRVGWLYRVEAYLARSSTSTHAEPRAGFPLLVDGAGAQGVPHPGGERAQRRGLLDTDTAFAADSVARGFSLAFVDYGAEFAMPIGGRDFYYLVGAQEVADWYAGWTPAETLDWTPAIAGSSPSGDLGYTIGRAVDRFVNDDGSVDLFYDKYLTLWRREADGSWRYIADGGSTSPAPGQ